MASQAASGTRAGQFGRCGARGQSWLATENKSRCGLAVRPRRRGWFAQLILDSIVVYTGCKSIGIRSEAGPVLADTDS